MKNQETKLAQSHRARRRAICLVAVAVLCLTFPMQAFASTDPLQSVNKLSEFLFAAVKAIGIILLLFGIVQIGMSLKGHDPGQRAAGFMTFFGGVIIAFSKEILDMIM